MISSLDTRTFCHTGRHGLGMSPTRWVLEDVTGALDSPAGSRRPGQAGRVKGWTRMQEAQRGNALSEWRAAGTAIKTLLGMPASHTGGPGFEF